MNPAILISFDYQRGSVTEGQRGGRQSTDCHATCDILVHHIMGVHFFWVGDKILTAGFFSGERMMNQSKDQTLKMKDTAIRIHQHQAPFSTEQDVISPGRFTFRSQNAVTNTSLSRTFIVLAPRTVMAWFRIPNRPFFGYKRMCIPFLKQYPLVNVYIAMENHYV